ncbi:MAG: C39 family peptidase [Jatrophihabitans sp.]
MSNLRRLLVLFAVLALTSVGLAGTATSASASVPGSKILSYSYIGQSYEWDCGPTSGQMVMSQWGISTSKQEMIDLMGADGNGADSVANVIYALNHKIGRAWYRTVYINGSTATGAQKATFKQDLLDDIATYGHAFIANVVGSQPDTSGLCHSGSIARVADPAYGNYWMNTSTLADWVAERGYAI